MARRQQLSVRLSLSLAAMCAVFLLIGGAAQAGAPPLPTVEHVVSEGETLWGIASATVGPDEDIRIVVAQIKRLSGMTSSALRPGQVLLLPQG